jgi:hypothetical protein
MDFPQSGLVYQAIKITITAITVRRKIDGAQVLKNPEQLHKKNQCTNMI